MPEITDFTVGGYVRYSASGSWGHEAGSDLVPDGVYKVLDVHRSGLAAGTLTLEGVTSVHDYHSPDFPMGSFGFMMFVPCEAPTPVLGDRVRVTQIHPGAVTDVTGMTGTLVANPFGGLGVDLDVDPDQSGDHPNHIVNADPRNWGVLAVEHYSEPAPIKVGDHVRILEALYAEEFDFPNVTGIVTEVDTGTTLGPDGTPHPFTVEIDDEHAKYARHGSKDYLHCVRVEHIDTTTSKEDTTMPERPESFAVGDRVVITDLRSPVGGERRGSGRSSYVGKTATVVDSERGSYVLEFDDESLSSIGSWSYDVLDPEPIAGETPVAEAAPVADFKTGDRVEVVGYGHGWDGPATILDHHPGSPFLRIDSDGLGIGAFEPEYIRPLVEVDAPTATLVDGTVITIGDSVRVNTDQYGRNRGSLRTGSVTMHHDEIVTVTEISPRFFQNDGWIVNGVGFEWFTAPPVAPTATLSEMVASLEGDTTLAEYLDEDPFKVGDRVAMRLDNHITRNDWVDSNTLESRIASGDQGTVAEVTHRSDREGEADQWILSVTWDNKAIDPSMRREWSYAWFDKVEVEASDAPARPLIDFSGDSRATVREYAAELKSRVLDAEHNTRLQNVADGQQVDAYDLNATLMAAMSLCATRAGQSMARREWTKRVRALAHIVQPVLENHADTLPAYAPGDRSRRIETLEGDLEHQKQRVIDLEDERSTLTQAASDERRRLCAEIDAARAAMDSEVEIRTNVQARVDLLEANLETRQAMAEEAQQNYLQAQNAADVKQRVIDDLRSTMETMQRDATEAERDRVVLSNALDYVLKLLKATPEQHAQVEGFKDGVGTEYDYRQYA